MKSILVKVFLVLNLLLCAAVLGFGIKTFKDREVIKARTVIHRQNIEKIAETLAWGEQLNWEKASERKSGPFQLPDPSNMEELGSFTTQLQGLEELAAQRVNQLAEQYAELTGVQDELETVRANLTERIADLAATRGEVSKLEDTLTESKNQLQEATAEISALDMKNKALQNQVDSLDTQITNQKTLISRVESDLKIRTGERNRIQELLAACLQPKSNSDDGPNPWHERTAQILAVEPQWNYVVIDKGEVDTLPMYLEAFVHRGDEFVGKIRVIQVDRTVALAEILQGTLAEGVTFEAGDNIFF